MNSNDALFRRNKLLVKIVWSMLILGIAVNFVTGAGMDSNIVLATVGVITCGIATFLTYKRIIEQSIMYVISTIVTILTILLIYTGPVITTYFLVYVNLSIMTLYSRFRAIVFSTILGVILTAYLIVSPFKELDLSQYLGHKKVNSLC